MHVMVISEVGCLIKLSDVKYFTLLQQYHPSNSLDYATLFMTRARFLTFK